MNASPDGQDRLRAELEAARLRISELEAELRRIRAELARSTESASARIALSAARRVRRLVPPDSSRQRGLHAVASRTLTLVDHGPSALVETIRRERTLRRAIGVADTPAARGKQYRRWLALHTPSSSELAAMRAQAAALATAPVISLVMPVHNPEPGWLETAIESVLEQAYPHLELCIADDASTTAGVRAVLERAARDSRVRITYRDRQGGIAVASDSAIGLASGEYIGFIDHDDVLRPHALYAVAHYLREHPDADLVYSDEDKLLPDGDLGWPVFKPDFSPDRLLAENFINHFTVVRRSLLNEVGGFRTGFDGSQDHDLMLRMTERSARVGHIADVLYSWRMAPGSTAVSADHKPLAREAGRRAVDDALERRGVTARVEFGPSPGLYIPRYPLVGAPAVDVLVVARTAGTDTQECVANIKHDSTYVNRHITVIQTSGALPSAINAAVAKLTGEHIVVLDASIRVITPEWLEVLLELSQRDGIGAVGLRLRYTDGAVAHEGVIVGRVGIATCVDQVLRVIKETSAVSGACVMTKRSVFDAAFGMDEHYDRALFDVDYCMRVRALGHRVLCTPLAEMSWGDARGIEESDETSRDQRTFVDRWRSGGEIADPYLNVNVHWPNPLSLRLEPSRQPAT